MWLLQLHSGNTWHRSCTRWRQCTLLDQDHNACLLCVCTSNVCVLFVHRNSIFWSVRSHHTVVKSAKYWKKAKNRFENMPFIYEWLRVRTETCTFSQWKKIEVDWSLILLYTAHTATIVILVHSRRCHSLFSTIRIMNPQCGL